MGFAVTGLCIYVYRFVGRQLFHAHRVLPSLPYMQVYVDTNTRGTMMELDVDVVNANICFSTSTNATNAPCCIKPVPKFDISFAGLRKR